MNKGLFLGFEGIDYSGKDTQAIKTVLWLRKLGYFVDYSNEPDDKNPLGHSIKQVLQKERKKPDYFQRLYILERGQHLFSFILPQLERGNIYVTIRYGHSTIAYGMLDGSPAEKFIQMHEDVLGPMLIWPDITFLIDVSGEEAARRLVEAKNKPELFEKKETLEKVRQNYLSLARHPYFKDHPIVVVNGERPEEEIFEDIKNIILPKLPLFPNK
jgi:dTMP kinase